MMSKVFEKLEWEIQQLGEDLISLQNEKEILEKGIETINKIIKDNIYIEPKTIEDLMFYFLTDEEDLVLYPEKEKEIQRILKEYDNILNDDKKYDMYQNLVNLLMLLDENPRAYFPTDIGKLQILKNKAKAKLEKVRREYRQKHSELTQLRRFERKLEELKKIQNKIDGVKIEESKHFWELIGYSFTPKKKRIRLINLRKKGKNFYLKRNLLLELFGNKLKK